MWDLIDEKLGEKTGAKKGDTIRKYTDELIALGRTSVPEDVAGTVSFLAGRDSDYMSKLLSLGCMKYVLICYYSGSDDCH
jgi:NAD(P)-dependent dehydrogenase (short-subunit alcohol dehydrogenase family)